MAVALATGATKLPRSPRSARANSSAPGDAESTPASNEADPAAGDGVAHAYHRCRKLGMRLSRQRRMVLDLLWSEKSHLSARDIFEQLNQMGRNIGQTSVYQNLEALQSAGVIECLDRANGRLYGYRADPHSHITCLDSGSIEDLDVCLPEELLRQIEHRTGYRIESYTLNLCGRRA
jgi:Fur family ferric uptake transcriptional regulator